MKVFVVTEYGCQWAEIDAGLLENPDAMREFARSMAARFRMDLLKLEREINFQRYQMEIENRLLYENDLEIRRRAWVERGIPMASKETVDWVHRRMMNDLERS